MSIPNGYQRERDLRLWSPRLSRLLMIYDGRHLSVKTIFHSLECFKRHSQFDFYYADARAPCCYDLSYFDAVLVHYSVRYCWGTLPKDYQESLRTYHGLKALFVQDEYDRVHATWEAITSLGIDVVFTVVPPEAVHKVYPPERFPRTTFVSILTGYIPEQLERLVTPPPEERGLLIGYRGRELAWWYGDLGREKLLIGQRMKSICDARGLPTDIAWKEDERIYGDRWFQFLASCKATLGTESGSNIFDFDGALAQTVRHEIMANPGASYEEIHDKYLRGHDGKIVMNQISPKIFEAVACRTALILFEGDYSGILTPGKHFLALKKDFSNVDEVLLALLDDRYLRDLTDRAHGDLVDGDRFSYRTFVRQVDAVLAARLTSRAAPYEPSLPSPPCDALLPFQKLKKAIEKESLLHSVWQSLPVRMQHALRPLIGRAPLKDYLALGSRAVRLAVRPVIEGLRNFRKKAG
ncbi:MAG: hypothetical protein HY040_26760 [Planctomycetes bacterium]|nr:hypothetical protein [Planctomycetota bacterium]